MESTKPETRNPKKNPQKGFTLVEMIVSIALFSIVMVVCVTALLALVNANRKAQALQSVMNNLNISLDDMARNIRMGSHYHCSSTIDATTHDCPNDVDNQTFIFEHFGGSRSDFSDQWIYKYDAPNKRILKSINGGTDYVSITAPEVAIDNMKFYVIGTTIDDTTQPRVTIVVSGTANAANVKSKESFHIQVTAVQRAIDL